MKLAAIDIGSNSIKLVVVESAGGDSFAVLARERDVVRLGHDTLRDGFLSPEAIARAATSVNRMRAVAQARGAEQVFAIATASVRAASNAAEFIAQVHEQTGVLVEVLSGVEEARLIGLAAAHGCATRGASVLNLDIGGGSTELSLMEGATPQELFSVQVGAVGLTERFINNDPVKPKELRALREEIAGAFSRPARELRGSQWQLTTGTSGTIIAVGEALRLRSQRADANAPKATHPFGVEIDVSHLLRFNERMAALNVAGRRAVPGISAQRAEIIVAGGQILEGAMRALFVEQVRTCDWALREGVILDRLRALDAESRPPVADDIDPRLRGAHIVGQRFSYEAAHAHHVAGLAERLFDALAPTYKLARHERTLLAAAALLHDVGYAVAHESHHKHSLYLIKHTELTGFSEAERLLIANIARYHRRSPPKDRHPDFAALNTPDRELVWRLGALLRLAEALDRSHDGRVRDLVCEWEKGTLRIGLVADAACDAEIAAADTKREMFEQAFNVKITFVSQTGLEGGKG